MEDEQPLNSNGNNINNSMWRNSMLSTTLSLPLTRHSSHSCGDPMEGENCGSSSGSSELYSKPVVFLDVMWNLAFVVVSVVVMLLAIKERPSTPLRVWVSGYAFQCLLHVGILWFHYLTNKNSAAAGGGGDRVAVHELSPSQRHSRIVKKLETINTIVSSIWWMMGFYWIVVGGQSLLQDSPRLYWLTVVFLAFDVFFIIFCIVMACSFFLAIFCLIPIIAIAYAVATRKGACEDDIRSLPKYRYRLASPLRTMNNGEKQDAFGTGLESGSSNSSNELALYPEDSDCCICLCPYVDGVELHSLPCNHHFHCGCISKWLRINATCPLCKFNIRRADTLV